MKELTRAEEEIMQTLWSLKKASVKEILAELPDPKPAYNTVSTIVRILEQKGMVDHESRGRTHLYFPIVEKDAYRSFSMRKVMDNYFGGSLKNMVSFFVDKDDVSSRELDDILKIIDQKKKK